MAGHTNTLSRNSLSLLIYNGLEDMKQTLTQHTQQLASIQNEATELKNNVKYMSRNSLLLLIYNGLEDMKQTLTQHTQQLTSIQNEAIELKNNVRYMVKIPRLELSPQSKEIVDDRPKIYKQNSNLANIKESRPKPDRVDEVNQVRELNRVRRVISNENARSKNLIKKYLSEQEVKYDRRLLLLIHSALKGVQKNMKEFSNECRQTLQIMTGDKEPELNKPKLNDPSDKLGGSNENKRDNLIGREPRENEEKLNKVDVGPIPKNVSVNCQVIENLDKNNCNKNDRKDLNTFNAIGAKKVVKVFTHDVCRQIKPDVSLMVNIAKPNKGKDKKLPRRRSKVMITRRGSKWKQRSYVRENRASNRQTVSTLGRGGSRLGSKPNQKDDKKHSNGVSDLAKEGARFAKSDVHFGQGGERITQPDQFLNNKHKTLDEIFSWLICLQEYSLTL